MIRSVPRLAGRIALVAVIVVLAFGLIGGTAFADPASNRVLATGSGKTLAAADPSSGASDGANGCSATTADEQRIIGDSKLLTINRWGDEAGDLHDLYSAGVAGTGDLDAKAQNRFLFTSMLNLGNAAWQASANLSGFAARFCVLDSLGNEVDGVAAKIGNALFDSGLAILAVAVAVLVVLWRRGSGGGPHAWRRVVRTGGVFVLMFVLLLGARASTPGNPGVGSPSWVLTKVSSSISTLAALPVQALSDTTSFSNTQEGSGDGAKAVTDCSYFVQNMKGAYKATYGTQLDQLAAATPITIDAMWQESGLRVFVDQQFGQENELGAKVFCRYLEWAAKSKVGKPGDTLQTETATTGQGTGTTIGLTFNGGGPTIPATGSLPFYVGPAKTAADVQTMGWAACNWTGSGWQVDPAFAEVTGGPDGSASGNKITADMCQEWWTTEPSADAASGTAFWWDDDQEDYMASTTSAPEARNFIASFHGWNPSGGFALALAFLLTSLGILVIFGGLALAIIIAKILVVLMILLIFLMLLRAMFGDHGNEQLRNYTRRFIGVLIFTFAVSIIYALIALTTGILVKGTASLGRGSLVGVMWTGLAPLIAVLALHFFFKVLRMPSPFTPSGAMAFGGAAKGLGVAAGVGLSRIGHGARRGVGAVRRGLPSNGGGKPAAGTGGGSLAFRMDPYNTADNVVGAGQNAAVGGVSTAPAPDEAQRGDNQKLQGVDRAGLGSDSGAVRIAAARGRLHAAKVRQSASAAMHADPGRTERLRAAVKNAGRAHVAGAGVVAAGVHKALPAADRARPATGSGAATTKGGVARPVRQSRSHQVRSSARVVGTGAASGPRSMGTGVPSTAAAAAYHLSRRRSPGAPTRPEPDEQHRWASRHAYREFHQALREPPVQPTPVIRRTPRITADQASS